MLEANQLWLHHCLFIIYSDIASATTCNSTVQTCHDHDHGGYWVAVDATRAEPALTLLHANFQNITLTSLDLRKVLAYFPNCETPCTLKQNVFFWRLSDRNKLCYTCNIHVKSSPKWCFKPRTGWTQHRFQWTLLDSCVQGAGTAFVQCASSIRSPLWLCKPAKLSRKHRRFSSICSASQHRVVARVWWERNACNWFGGGFSRCFETAYANQRKNALCILVVTKAWSKRTLLKYCKQNYANCSTDQKLCGGASQNAGLFGEQQNSCLRPRMGKTIAQARSICAKCDSVWHVCASSAHATPF